MFLEKKGGHNGEISILFKKQKFKSILKNRRSRRYIELLAVELSGHSTKNLARHCSTERGFCQFCCDIPIKKNEA